VLRAGKKTDAMLTPREHAFTTATNMLAKREHGTQP
jgi:hypothetical protein